VIKLRTLSWRRYPRFLDAPNVITRVLIRVSERNVTMEEERRDLKMPLLSRCRKGP
jgi:hypothetical protein